MNTDPNSETAYVLWTPPTAGINSDGAVTLASNYKPGMLFHIGTTTVNYVAMDACGNGRAFVSFDVIVSGGLVVPL